MARNSLSRPADKEKAISLYKAGATYNEISKVLNVNKSSISYWCRDLAAQRLKEKMEATRLRKIEEKEKRKLKQKPIEQEPAEHPYTGWYIRHTNNSDGVIRITLYNPDSKQTRFMSKARYVMSVHLGRVLENHERVYHKNGKEDDVENLFVSTLSQKSIQTINEKTVSCGNPSCNNLFFKRYQNRKYCSRKCFHAVRTANRKVRVYKPRSKATFSAPIKHTKECVWCESTFTTSNPNGEICSKKCRRELLKYQRDYGTVE